MKTLTNVPLDTKQAILLMGPPGGGKTTFALQWPGVWIADCDMNLAGPLRYIKSRGINVDVKYDTIPYDDDGKPLELHEWWSRLVVKTATAIKDPTIQTIVVDSLTQVDNMLVEHTMQTQRTKVMEIQHWRPFRKDLHEYIMRARSCGKTFLMLCHEEILFDKKGQVEKYRPSVSTKISDYFGYYFTDIWRCTLVDGGAGKLKAVVTTHPTAVSDLKNSLLLGREIEADYRVVERILSGGTNVVPVVKT
jgi:hypothetical protein